MAVAQKMNARYAECSSKEMTGVDEIFEQAINTVVANDPSNQRDTRRDSRRTVQSSSGPPGTSSGAGGMRRRKRKCNFL